jgi:hypothetical protein
LYTLQQRLVVPSSHPIDFIFVKVVVNRTHIFFSSKLKQSLPLTSGGGTLK